MNPKNLEHYKRIYQNISSPEYLSAKGREDLLYKLENRSRFSNKFYFVGAALCLLLLVGGTISFAQSSRPGDLLYSVKTISQTFLKHPTIKQIDTTNTSVASPSSIPIHHTVIVPKPTTQEKKETHENGNGNSQSQSNHPTPTQTLVQEVKGITNSILHGDENSNDNKGSQNSTEHSQGHGSSKDK